MSELHVIVPADIDDPARPSGGNTYDRHVLGELTARGWTVHEHHDVADVAAIGDGATVLVDGLLASDALLPHAARLRLVVLAHMPLAFAGAAAVVTTSEWTRRQLGAVHVAEPGVEPAPLAPGSPGGRALLCVAALTPGKGHDVLLDALRQLDDLAWECTCAGSVVRDPAWADAVRGRAGRARFSGPLTGAALARAYARADLLVLPSRGESYGMVLTEALARGIPVVASDVGGVREALGPEQPGLLVAPGDPDALAQALRAWLTDPALRDRLRAAARERRATLRGWDATADTIEDVLAGVALAGAAA